MSVKKQIIKNNLKYQNIRFNYECTPYGSLISSLLLVSNQKWSNAKYVNKLSKAKFPYLDEEGFVEKTLKAVGLDINDFKGHTIGVYQDRSIVFAPVAPVDCKMKDGSTIQKILPLPLTSYPEGFFPNTIVNSFEKVELMEI